MSEIAHYYIRKYVNTSTCSLATIKVSQTPRERERERERYINVFSESTIICYLWLVYTKNQKHVTLLSDL